MTNSTRSTPMNFKKAVALIFILLASSANPVLCARQNVPEPKTTLDSGVYMLYYAGKNDYQSGHYNPKKYSDARECFSAAVNLSPNGPYAGLSRLELARAETALGNYVGAEQILKKLLADKGNNKTSEGPSKGEILLNLGVLYSTQKRFALAESNFLAAIATIDPKDSILPVALDNLAMMYDKMGSYAKASPLYQRAQNILDSAKDKDHEEIQNNLDNYSMHYFNQKKFAEAEPLLKRATEIRPGQTDDDALFFLEKHAAALRELGRTTDADNLNGPISQMKTDLAAYKKKPRQLESDRILFIQSMYRKTGVLAIADETSLGNYDEAIRLASRIIALLAQTQSKDVYMLYLMRADLYKQTGQYNKTIADLDIVDVYDPSHHELQYATCILRAEAYRELGEHQKSIDQLTKSIAAKPDALAYAMRSAEYRKIGDKAKAEEDESKARTLGLKNMNVDDFLKVINQFPKDAAEYTKRGDDWNNMGQTEKAISDYTKAISLDPKFARAFTQRGNLYHQLNDDAKAAQDYKNAAALNPQLKEGATLELNEQFKASLTKGYDKKSIESYLNKGADINTVSSVRGTPLILAVQNGDEEFVQQLIGKGAKLDLSFYSPQEIFRPAGQDINYRCPLKVIHSPPRTKRVIYKTPLIAALEFDPKTPQLNQAKKRIALMLIQQGAKSDQAGSGDSLCTAIQFTQDRQIIETLINSGAPINGNAFANSDTDGMSPIALATQMGNKEIVALLAEKGASINSSLRNGAGRGYTPLCWAIETNNVEMMKLLLSKGADPTVKENDGTTALQLATSKPDHKCLETLHAAGF